MSADKYPNISSSQMEATVFIDPRQKQSIVTVAFDSSAKQIATLADWNTEMKYSHFLRRGYYVTAQG